MSGNYILDGQMPILVDDYMEWARWYQTAERHVALTELDGVRVSTVFLGLDHNFGEDGPPILFETMVFGLEDDQPQERYSTWDEAIAGHEKMVEWAREQAAVTR